MLPVNCGSHSDYQKFVTINLRKYYPNPDALARSTWNIIERFCNLDFSCASKYDSHGFLQAFFRMKAFLPDYEVSKLLLDSAHNAMPYYQCFQHELSSNKCLRKEYHL